MTGNSARRRTPGLSRRRLRSQTKYALVGRETWADFASGSSSSGTCSAPGVDAEHQVVHEDYAPEERVEVGVLPEVRDEEADKLVRVDPPRQMLVCSGFPSGPAICRTRSLVIPNCWPICSRVIRDTPRPVVHCGSPGRYIPPPIAEALRPPVALRRTGYADRGGHPDRPGRQHEHTE